MTLHKEVIRHAMSVTDCAEEAAELLSHYQAVQQRVADRQSRIDRIKKKAEDDIRKLLSASFCKHEVRKYHGDPSGGSDSHEECLICGEMLYEKPVRFT